MAEHFLISIAFAIEYTKERLLPLMFWKNLNCYSKEYQCAATYDKAGLS